MATKQHPGCAVGSSGARSVRLVDYHGNTARKWTAASLGQLAGICAHPEQSALTCIAAHAGQQR